MGYKCPSAKMSVIIGCVSILIVVVYVRPVAHDDISNTLNFTTPESSDGFAGYGSMPPDWPNTPSACI